MMASANKHHIGSVVIKRIAVNMVPISRWLNTIGVFASPDNWIKLARLAMSILTA